MRRMFAWIRFSLERVLLRGLHYRLLLAVTIVLTVAIVGGATVVLFDPSISDWDEGVWWAFLRLTDPGYLGDDKGLVRTFVSTVVTVLGYLLFLGLLIAILTQWLENTIAKLESGITPVVLSNHVIIVGWTNRTPTIVANLLRTGPRLQRFLERHHARSLRIVILAENVDAELTRELRERLGDLWNDRQVFLRSGIPLRLDDLERVAFRDAAVLILPGAGFGEPNPEYVDAQMVKTLLSVSKDVDQSHGTLPLAVVELYDGRRGTVARRSYSADIELIVSDEIVSRMIAQSVRQRGLCSVFKELFTLNQGNALLLREVGRQAGATFGDVRGSFDKAIVLGIIRPGGSRPNLNPDPRTVLSGDDLLVFLARRFEDCVADDPVRSTMPARSESPAHAVAKPRRVLILGWSRRVPTLLWEFERYGKDAYEIDIVSGTPIEERERMLSRYGRETLKEGLRHIEASYTVPGVLNRLEPQGYDNIVLLASERLAEEEHADAVTVFTYQVLKGLLPVEGQRPEIFVELLEEENESLFEAELADVIVSPMLVSYLLSQVALRRELAALFAELSRPRGVQIVLHPAQEYVRADGPVRFEDVDRIAAARGEMALGMRCIEDGPDANLMLNPERAMQWTLKQGDTVVVLTSQAGETRQSRGRTSATL